MKLIRFFNSFCKRELSLLKIENTKDFENFLEFYFKKADSEIAMYLEHIKPSHVATTTALSSSVALQNSINVMKGAYKTDMLDENEKTVLRFFTNESAFLMNEYAAAGFPKKIFVYTTGNDMDQMRKYIDVAQKNGFSVKIVFGDAFAKEKKKRLILEKNVDFNFCGSEKMENSKKGNI